jgi:hypothetical protein
MEEAGANPAWSRHCHRGASLASSPAEPREAEPPSRRGGKAEGSADPEARKLRPPFLQHRGVVTPEEVRAYYAAARIDVPIAGRP